VAWEIEFTDEFQGWWNTLAEEQQDASLTARKSPRPDIRKCASCGHRARADPYGRSNAFNPLRTAVLLIAGDKTGDDRWYDKFVPVADRLFEEHLNELKKEGRL